MGTFRRVMIITLVLTLMTPMLSGCSVWRGIRATFGYEDPPPQIVEEHLAPCQQPHRGSPHRDCSGERTNYTPRPVGRKQIY